jgi:hypothetical protein
MGLILLKRKGWLERNVRDTVAGTEVGQSTNLTLNKHYGHFTIFVTPVLEEEAKFVLQFCTLFLILDVTPQLQVLLYLEW